MPSHCYSRAQNYSWLAVIRRRGQTSGKASAAATAAEGASPSAASARKGGGVGGLRGGVDASKAKVKSENNRSLRKMKKNRSIVRQMLFPNSNNHTR